MYIYISKQNFSPFCYFVKILAFQHVHNFVQYFLSSDYFDYIQPLKRS